MPNLNPNSTSYVHSYEPNTNDLVHAMDYNYAGQPVIRTSIVNQDSANLTAFGRTRTANTRLIGEFRNMYGTTGPAEILTHFEQGGSQTVNLPQTHTMINVTTESGSRSLRQSRKYHPYIPGTTNLSFISFTFAPAAENLQQSVGLYDDSNGIFLRLNGNIAEMVIRKGGVDNEVIPQSDWNVDKLDGTSASKINVDWSKSQIFFCDYQWLGVGRVRVGISINGRIVICHQFTHANELTEPYMFQPSLPVRWEIKNVGPTAQPASMMTICYAVYCEGSDIESGFESSISSGTTKISLAAPNDVKGILAVRLRNTVNNQPVNAYAKLKDWQVVTSLTTRYKIMILQDKADITLANGSPVTDSNWTQATPTGWCEYLTDFRLVNNLTPANSVILFDGYATGASNRGAATDASIDNRSATIHQNFDSTDSMIFVLVAYRIANDNAELLASLNWIEIK